MALSTVDTYAGNPTAAASRTPDLDADGNPSDRGEKGGRDRIENTLGARFSDLGNGRDAFNSLENTLRNSGHGSQAVIITQDANGRAHAWNAVNHNGKIVWIDTQSGEVSEKPLHIDQAKHVWHIPLDADRNPIDTSQSDDKDSKDAEDSDNQKDGSQNQNDDASQPENSENDGQPENTQNPQNTDTNQPDNPNSENTRSPTTRTTNPRTKTTTRPSRKTPRTTGNRRTPRTRRTTPRTTPRRRRATTPTRQPPPPPGRGPSPNASNNADPAQPSTADPNTSRAGWHARWP